MGKLFNRRGHSEEDYDDEEFDDDEELDEDEEDEEFDDDEEDEEDDGEEDDDELDEEDDDENDEDDDEDDEEDRREYRHKRRVRNQIVAYSVVLVVFLAIAAGGVVLGSKIVSSIKEKKQAEELVRQQEQAEEQEAEEVVIDTPEPAKEENAEDIYEELVETSIADMPLGDKIAGLFIVTPEAITGVTTATQAGNGTQEALNQYPVGGLIYFGQNILDEEQIKEMLSNTKSMSRYRIFLAVDEEGGSVSRVANSGVDVTQVEAMATIGEGGDPAKAQESGAAIGSYLKELGFNLDFAPVADVVPEGGNSVLGDRSFGSDPAAVGDMVSNFVGGLESTGVSSCLKHFPGLGEATEDTHETWTEITKTLDEMRASDFVPFQAGIDAGADFVMVSHVAASAVDQNGLPSSLSEKIITDVLRNELGFEGVIITDALNMKAITEYYPPEEAAVMAIEAGADMLLMPEDFTKAYEALLAAVQDGRISEERINDSLRRIYRVKCEEEKTGL